MTRARDVANVLSTATSLATDTETAAAISSHNSATTNVHGITDTSALATVNSAVTIPGAPTSVSASAGNTEATVTFIAPANTGGSTILGYVVTSSPGNITAAGTSSPITVTGLTNGTSYTFTVVATNIKGSSVASSASSSVTPSATFSVDYLVIAGGGGGAGISSGGAYGAPGGGAGGYRTSLGTSGGNSSAESQLSFTANTNYSVMIGAGGTSTVAGNTRGTNTVFHTITSTGGGARQGSDYSGGSGAGSFDFETRGLGTANQGFAGGQGSAATSPGGGGGAGGAGSTARQGGVGLTSSISGSSVGRGGGGGGGYTSSTNATDGGGSGGISPSNNGSNATANTGGGGGGGAAQGTTTYGGNGGSGIVILKYPDARTITIGAGLTGSTAAPAGGFKVTTITAGTGNVSWV